MTKVYVRDYETYNNERVKLQVVKVFPEKPERYDYIIETDKRVKRHE